MGSSCNFRSSVVTDLLRLSFLVVSRLLADAEAVQQGHKEGGKAGGKNDDADVPVEKMIRLIREDQ